MFTHTDYKNALILLSRSQVQHNEIRLQKNLEKLAQMFDDDAHFHIHTYIRPYAHVHVH